MHLRIPSSTTTNKHEPVVRAIEFAATNTGVDEFTMAQALSYFLEQLADEVTRGRTVVIPGFGMFSPVPDGQRVYGARKCRVRFHAAVGFAQQVRHGAPPLDENARRFQTYRTNHSAGDNVAGNASRVFTAMASFRREIAEQLAHARD